MSLPHRRALLTVALAVALLDTRGRPEPPEQTMVRQWLDTWTGVGLIVTGMERQGYRLHLTNVDLGMWRATFTGGPMLGEEGFGTAPTLPVPYLRRPSLTATALSRAAG